jgi:hypothetical protein
MRRRVGQASVPVSQGFCDFDLVTRLPLQNKIDNIAKPEAAPFDTRNAPDRWCLKLNSDMSVLLRKGEKAAEAAR